LSDFIQYIAKYSPKKNYIAFERKITQKKTLGGTGEGGPCNSGTSEGARSRERGPETLGRADEWMNDDRLAYPIFLWITSYPEVQSEREKEKDPWMPSQKLQKDWNEARWQAQQPTYPVTYFYSPEIATCRTVKPEGNYATQQCIRYSNLIRLQV
jgi:hypothetical protein